MMVAPDSPLAQDRLINVVSMVLLKVSGLPSTIP